MQPRDDSNRVVATGYRDPGAPRPETGRQREAGLLASGSSFSPTFPRPRRSQWYVGRALAGYSCGGSRGIYRVPFRIPLGNLVLKRGEYSHG